MKIETPLIAMMVVSLVFGGMLYIFTSLGSNYDVSLDQSEFQTQNGTSIGDALNQWTASKNKMDNITAEFNDEELTDTGSIFPFVSLALRTGKLMIGSVNMAKTSINTVAQILGIPGEIIGGLLAILLIILVVSLVMLLIGRSNY